MVSVYEVLMSMSHHAARDRIRVVAVAMHHLRVDALRRELHSRMCYSALTQVVDLPEIPGSRRVVTIAVASGELLVHADEEVGENQVSVFTCEDDNALRGTWATVDVNWGGL